MSYAPIINAQGISSPTFEEIFLQLQSAITSISGADVYIDPDSQDGQMIGIFAKAAFDASNAVVATYQSFRPSQAQGEGLSSIVKINGISRNNSSSSTAVGLVSGIPNSTIYNGVVKDSNSNLWNLPSSVTLADDGTAVVTITANVVGAIHAEAGSINQINNPQYGWYAFSNTSAAVPGTGIELDSQLKVRQSNSVALPAQTVMSGMLAAIANIAGVTKVTGYSNDTEIIDINGVTPHAITTVVAGGDVNVIASVIALYKAPGIPTYASPGTGAISIPVSSPQGHDTIINFNVLQLVPVYIDITIAKLTNYAVSTDDAIKTAIVNYITSLGIGTDVYAAKIEAVASLICSPLESTFYVANLFIGIAQNPTTQNNIEIAYTKAATTRLENISVHI